MRVLITRPQPDAERTKAAVRAFGFSPLVTPLLRIAATPDAALPMDPPAALLFTSANAPRILADLAGVARLTGLPVFTVGNRTAETAFEAGFAHILSADGDGEALTDLVRRSLDPAAGKLVWLAGEDRAGDPAGKLVAAGFDVETRVIYRAETAVRLPPALESVLAAKEPAIALHYSRRTASTFLNVAKVAGHLDAARTLTHLALSGQVAEPLRQAGCATILVAEAPRETELLKLLRDL